MNHDSVPQFLGLLVIVLGSARIAGILSRWSGQPAVLGELVAGVLVGPSLLGWIDPQHAVLAMFAQISVVLLLFQIGLETDIRRLVAVLGPAFAVAVVGMILPFATGYGLCRLFEINHAASLTTGAVLSVTGIGVTARILSDLGRLDDIESQIIIGAAIIDDMLALIVLTVIGNAFEGETVTIESVAIMAGTTVGFLIGTLWLGSRIVPHIIHLLAKLDLPGSSPIAALIVAFSLAWLAAATGSGVIIGAFAAGLLLRRSQQAKEIELGLFPLGRLFVPIFFVMVGAAVNLRLLNPMNVENHSLLWAAGLLFLVAVGGKLLAGYAPFWFSCQKAIIGWAMVPRGAVGLVFAQFALTKGILDERLFSAVTLMVILTTLIAPPILRLLLPPKEKQGPVESSFVGELISEP